MTSTRFLLISAAVTAVGFLGLLAGFLMFPDSNLLGGFGLIFGPIYWLGGIMLAIASVIWAFANVRRRMSPTVHDEAPESESAKESE